ncbi:MAG: hypothetical protein J7647_30780 [Cyanobacteria bacterium SBLK]|nr:hypothetical protein [Cyanobacteria bacterium SBLK]
MDDPLKLKLAKLFSRFPLFNDAGNRYYLAWRSHPLLYKNMQRLLDRRQNLSEDRCARYFLQLLKNEIVPEQNDDLAYAKKHLTSYLCTSSYIVAKRLQHTYQKIDFFQHRYDERDYLQIAIQYANDPLKLLSGFDFQRRHRDGTLYFVKTFAKAVLERKIKDELYKYNQESLLGKYKDWGILRYDTTFKELKIALQSYIEADKIEPYLFVWHWFKETCKPCQQRSDRASPPPTFQELQNIARLYDDRYSCLATQIEAKQIEKMLQICIEAMQRHRNLKLYYPDSILNIENDRDRWDEFFTIENAGFENIPLNSLICNEERDEISALVRDAFESLSSEQKILLLLWKGLNLTQTQTGLVMDLPQYTVSRRQSKARQLMLKKFTQRMQQHFCDLNLDSETIKSAKEKMEEVFEKQARDFFKSLLPQSDRYIAISSNCGNTILRTRFLQSIARFFNLNRKNLSKVADDIDKFLQENVN